MASQGPNSSVTQANDASFGTAAWTNPTNAAAEDATNATVVNPALNTPTQYLKATRFGFSIPTGATINGIVVEIKKSRSSTLGVTDTDSRVRIVKSSGTIGTTDKASGTNWQTTLTYSTYGSSSDLWDEVWTPSDINDSNFGVVISAVKTAGAGNTTLNIDHIRITVHYTPAAKRVVNGTPAGASCVGKAIVG